MVNGAADVVSSGFSVGFFGGDGLAGAGRAGEGRAGEGRGGAGRVTASGREGLVGRDGLVGGCDVSLTLINSLMS